MPGQEPLGVPIGPESRRDQRKRRRDLCDATWQAFPDLGGTHWTIRLTAVRWVLATRDGEKLLATINDPAPWSIRGKVLRSVSDVRIADGPVYRSQWRRRSWFRWERFFVDAESGAHCLKLVGRHLAHNASGTVHVFGEPSPTEAGAHVWRFPVAETKAKNALMTAVDDLGNTIMRFRRTPELKAMAGLGSRIVSDDAGIDVCLSPGLKPNPQLLLIAAVASPWMITYFQAEATD
jgi:hypothetical protein